jgi:hypothetical protein
VLHNTFDLAKDVNEGISTDGFGVGFLMKITKVQIIMLIKNICINSIDDRIETKPGRIC